MNERRFTGVIGVEMDISSASRSTQALAQHLEAFRNAATKAMETVASKAETSAQRITQANNKISESEKQKTANVRAAAMERQRAADKELESSKGVNIEKRKEIEQERTARGTRIQAMRNEGHLVLQNAKTRTKVVEAEQRRETLLLKHHLSERTREAARVARVIDRTIGAPEGVRGRVAGAISGPQNAAARKGMVSFGMTQTEAMLSQLMTGGFTGDEARFLASAGGARPTSLGGKDVEAIKRTREEMMALRKDARLVEAAIKRALLAPEEVQARVAAALRGTGAQLARTGMVNVGATNAQAIRNQLGAAGFTSQQATFLAGGGGRRPAGLGGTPPRQPGGGGGFWGGAGGLIRGLGVGLGVGVGAYAVGNIARGLGEDISNATAYDRQRVAAEKLAGSQAELNALLIAYTKASGGAVSSTKTLENVSRLLATGYADTVPQIEKFVRATRGSSIAMGRPQDYIIQETQLALSNTSFKRLDQIGLGIEEVTVRIRSLRKENSGMTREAAFQQAVMDIMSEKYAHLGDTMEGQATGVEKLTKAWNDFRLAFGQTLQGPANAVADAIEDVVNAAMDGLEEFNKVVAEKEAWRAQNRARGATGPVVDPYVKIGLWGIEWRRRSEGATFGEGEPAWSSSNRPKNVVDPAANEAVEKIRDDYYQRFEDLEKNTAEERLRTIENYELQRENIIVAYGKSIVREEEDFARQRARGLRDYERNILELMQDAQDREAEWQEDLDDKIAEMREDANEKLTEVEEKYQKDKERQEKDHRERLMKAAGQLDAIGILEERKRWRKEQQERDEDHKEQVDKLRENLAEQIEDAQEAHAERLEDARKADAKRLEDMRAARALQLADEDEDRAVRLERQAQDHNDQLKELDRQHTLRLTQIAQQQEEERLALQEAFELALYEADYYVAGLAEKMKAQQELAQTWFDDYVNFMEKRLMVESDPGRYRLDENGRPVIPLDYGSQLGYTPPAQTSNMVTQQANRSIVISQGAISIYTMPGMESVVGEYVAEEITRLLEGNYQR